ncbi:NADH-quinone oxidoreductase subunit E [Thermacetogenium phaeum DSM 12270]|uniref:NADH-quinone oxidoreductase subunit E n=2 Tax=Thermacetogenium phaeum TaxID=85874 RepID=K4LEZ7_THEPS|nr:NADH-quinone oxidoreductase subunit NuoE [Thermacetogenium phaeum]AFV10667.1 NADH-quinone oxidoreductase subunit E [Thermacetogenium phaeum DSM 12270]KUK36499.1 MAG: NADH-quinone oxidoreductase subunit E [Thermacetogenium phaeum]
MAVNSQQAADREAMRKIVNSYPPERRHILAIMQDLQKHFYYLPKEALQMTAEHVNVPMTVVFSMATFYKAFSLVPKGRVVLKTCDGTACHIKGSNIVIDEIYKILGIKPGETTPDGQFSLETVNCLGCCSLAPVMMVNDQVYGHLTPDKTAEVIKKFSKTEGSGSRGGVEE